jgi:hypothetical protein
VRPFDAAPAAKRTNNKKEEPRLPGEVPMRRVLVAPRSVLGLSLVASLAAVLIAAASADVRITKTQVTIEESPKFGGYSWPGVEQYDRPTGQRDAAAAAGAALPSVSRRSGLIPSHESARA